MDRTPLNECIELDLSNTLHMQALQWKLKAEQGALSKGPDGITKILKKRIKTLSYENLNALLEESLPQTADLRATRTKFDKGAPVSPPKLDENGNEIETHAQKVVRELDERTVRVNISEEEKLARSEVVEILAPKISPFTGTNLLDFVKRNQRQYFLPHEGRMVPTTIMGVDPVPLTQSLHEGSLNLSQLKTFMHSLPKDEPEMANQAMINIIDSHALEHRDFATLLREVKAYAAPTGDGYANVLLAIAENTQKLSPDELKSLTSLVADSEKAEKDRAKIIKAATQQGAAHPAIVAISERLSANPEPLSDHEWSELVKVTGLRRVDLEQLLLKPVQPTVEEAAPMMEPVTGEELAAFFESNDYKVEHLRYNPLPFIERLKPASVNPDEMERIVNSVRYDYKYQVLSKLMANGSLSDMTFAALIRPLSHDEIHGSDVVRQAYLDIAEHATDLTRADIDKIIATQAPELKEPLMQIAQNRGLTPAPTPLPSHDLNSLRSALIVLHDHGSPLGIETRNELIANSAKEIPHFGGEELITFVRPFTRLNFDPLPLLERLSPNSVSPAEAEVVLAKLAGGTTLSDSIRNRALAQFINGGALTDRQFPVIQRLISQQGSRYIPNIADVLIAAARHTEHLSATDLDLLKQGMEPGVRAQLDEIGMERGVHPPAPTAPQNLNELGAELSKIQDGESVRQGYDARSEFVSAKLHEIPPFAGAELIAFLRTYNAHFNFNPLPLLGQLKPGSLSPAEANSLMENMYPQGIKNSALIQLVSGDALENRSVAALTQFVSRYAAGSVYQSKDAYLSVVRHANDLTPDNFRALRNSTSPAIHDELDAIAKERGIQLQQPPVAPVVVAPPPPPPVLSVDESIKAFVPIMKALELSQYGINQLPLMRAEDLTRFLEASKEPIYRSNVIKSLAPKLTGFTAEDYLALLKSHNQTNKALLLLGKPMRVPFDTAPLIERLGQRSVNTDQFLKIVRSFNGEEKILAFSGFVVWDKLDDQASAQLLNTLRKVMDKNDVGTVKYNQLLLTIAQQKRDLTRADVALLMNNTTNPGVRSAIEQAGKVRGVPGL